MRFSAKKKKTKVNVYHKRRTVSLCVMATMPVKGYSRCGKCICHNKKISANDKKNVFCFNVSPGLFDFFNLSGPHFSSHTSILFFKSPG